MNGADEDDVAAQPQQHAHDQELLDCGGGRGDQGRGLGRVGSVPGVGRGFAPIGAHRALDFASAPHNRGDDGLDKPKFSILNISLGS